MVHQMNLKAIYFDKIKSGEKIYEIRLNDEKRQLINIGDTIVFKKELSEETIVTIVKDLSYFQSFNEMFKTLPVEKAGFEGMSIENVIEIYHQFYSTEDEKKYGIVAIKVEV